MIFGEEKVGVRPYVNDDEPKSAQISRSFAGSNYFAQLNLTGLEPDRFDGEKSPTRAGFSLVILGYDCTQILSIERFYARENRVAP